MPDYLQRLTDSIFSLYGCEAKHVATTPVKEEFRGKTVFDGEVEVFELKGHPAAKRIFAWGYENPSDPKKLEVTAVLAVPPVTSELAAVRAAIAAEIQQKKGK
jgi:hypothetical protein